MYSPPPFVSSFSKYSRFYNVVCEGGTVGTQSGTANKIHYYPIVIPWAYPLKRFWVYNATISGNIDIGLYSRDGAKIVSTGSIAAAGASAMQFAAATYLISPGSYYLAYVASASGQATQVFSYFSMGPPKILGALQQLATFPLPAVMTPDVSADSYIRMFGFTLTESGF